MSISSKLSILALICGAPLAHAGSLPQRQPAHLGEHPAVIVARQGVRADPTAKFYLHPARLAWSLERPLSEGEHPAVLLARHESKPIDPNQFIVLHPAGGASPSQVP